MVTRYLPGDVVSRRKGVVMHRGLVMADGRILHNTPGRGEHLSSLEEFQSGRRLHVQRRALDERRRALAQARAQQAGRYNLFTNNCEHTVHRAASGKAHSPQLRGWVAGIGLAGATMALTRHPGWAAAAFALGRRMAAKR